MNDGFPPETDGRGSYEFRSLSPGSYRVIVSSPEEKSVMREFSVERNETARLRIVFP